METKTCSKCKCEKPLDAFSKDCRARDGLQYACKPCQAAAVKTWAKNNPDKCREKDKRRGLLPSRKAYARMKDKKRRDGLADVYVITRIVRKTNIPRDQVPRELIELKKLHLAIKRKLKDEQHHRPA